MSFQDLLNAFQEYASSKGTLLAMRYLKLFHVHRLADLPSSRYSAFVDGMRLSTPASARKTERDNPCEAIGPLPINGLISYEDLHSIKEQANKFPNESHKWLNAAIAAMAAELIRCRQRDAVPVFLAPRSEAD